jgi:hypothetical protein
VKFAFTENVAFFRGGIGPHRGQTDFIAEFQRRGALVEKCVHAPLAQIAFRGDFGHYLAAGFSPGLENHDFGRRIPCEDRVAGGQARYTGAYDASFHIVIPRVIILILNLTLFSLLEVQYFYLVDMHHA